MKDTNSSSTLCTCMNLSWEGGGGVGYSTPYSKRVGCSSYFLGVEICQRFNIFRG